MTCETICECYDIVILGAGPAGLSTLSALQESFSMDQMTDLQRNHVFSHCRKSTKGSMKRKKVAVVDPSGEWMTCWNQNFSKLGISFLRSPAMAHPDAFDGSSLVAYAVTNEREAELRASGCADHCQLQGLAEVHTGLWNLPSTPLFRDFCKDVSSRLPHTFYADHAVDIKKDASKDLNFSVHLKSGGTLKSKAVVLAMGALGDAIIPKGIATVPDERLLHWKNLEYSSSNPEHGIPCEWNDILVVGGGLTAVQVSQLALRGKPSCKVTLCSRRPLVEKHLDIGLEWADRRVATKCQADFYHQSVESKVAMLKEARGGGSVPPCYVRDVENLEKKGRLTRIVGNATFHESEAELLEFMPSLQSASNFKEKGDSPLLITIESKVHRYDGVIVACGVRPDCRKNPVCASLLQQFNDAKQAHGFPLVTEDLEWMRNVFVVGGMASLNLGPDAGNLMGMRRGATIVANTLRCHSWLRDTGNILANRFGAFDDFSSSDEETESESEDESSSETPSQDGSISSEEDLQFVLAMAE
ncbi:unnamed protein product [Cylindrotheca closterium]|uniref:FAD/NAD(P)-binding domain-containing protein n=1 Tax=Cylindrotheca closterium TaxID=2856 RepID=A0AAD2CU24_9STRA|nr:unnamed protein product [Cylindrotheca closterium]